MPSNVFSRRVRFVSFLWLLPLGLLAGCAGTPSKTAAKPRTGVDEAAVNALYARLDKDSGQLAGLLAADGAAADTGAQVKAALDDLRAASAQCASTPGCEAERFFSTFDRLLRLSVDGLADAGSETADAGADGGEAGETSPVIASLPAMERTITLLNGRELADILTLNGAVKAGIEQWLTQYRPNLMTAYVNYQFMRYRMWPEYHRAGLPEALLFGMLAKESGGKVHAVSRSGASGPLQFMYATGLRFGLNSIDGFDTRFDPGLSARANAAYINEQLRIFNGNLELVIGAYNGGEGRMQRLAGKGGTTSFWDPKVYAELPPETRDYVPMVLAAAWLFLHPERYNLKFPDIDGRPGTVTLAAPASIAELTICLGQEGGSGDGWFRALRNLNPALDPQQRQPAGTRLEVPVQLEAVYARNCADGRWRLLADDLHTATLQAQPAVARSAPRAGTPHLYVVRKGDSLAAIARRQAACVKADDIARLNGLRPPHYSIRAGQTLRLPGCAGR